MDAPPRKQNRSVSYEQDLYARVPDGKLVERAQPIIRAGSCTVWELLWHLWPENNMDNLNLVMSMLVQPSRVWPVPKEAREWLLCYASLIHKLFRNWHCDWKTKIVMDCDFQEFLRLVRHFDTAMEWVRRVPMVTYGCVTLSEESEAVAVALKMEIGDKIDGCKCGVYTAKRVGTYAVCVSVDGIVAVEISAPFRSDDVHYSLRRGVDDYDAKTRARASKWLEAVITAHRNSCTRMQRVCGSIVLGAHLIFHEALMKELVDRERRRANPKLRWLNRRRRIMMQQPMKQCTYCARKLACGKLPFALAEPNPRNGCWAAVASFDDRTRMCGCAICQFVRKHGYDGAWYHCETCEKKDWRCHRNESAVDVMRYHSNASEADVLRSVLTKMD